MTESPDERDRQRLPRPRGAPDDADAGAEVAGAVPDGPWSEWIPAPRPPVGDRLPRSTTPSSTTPGTPSGTTSATPAGTTSATPPAALVVAPDRLPARRPAPAAPRWRRAADGLAQAALLVAGAVADAVLAVGSLVARLLPTRPAAAGG